jgi:hypothetical protein
MLQLFYVNSIASLKENFLRAMESCFTVGTTNEEFGGIGFPFKTSEPAYDLASVEMVVLGRAEHGDQCNANYHDKQQ